MDSRKSGTYRPFESAQMVHSLLRSCVAGTTSTSDSSSSALSLGRLALLLLIADRFVRAAMFAPAAVATGSCCRRGRSWAVRIRIILYAGGLLTRLGVIHRRESGVDVTQWSIEYL